jgi:hypothetical protein
MSATGKPPSVGKTHRSSEVFHSMEVREFFQLGASASM